MQRFSEHCTIGLALTFAVSACGGSDESEGTLTAELSMTDSAGVVLVDQVVGPQMEVELVEELRIGSLDGDEATRFFTPRGGEFGPNGELYILDAGNHRVKVFSSEGEFLRSWGSQGDGPGEFSRLATQLQMADHGLLVVDAGRRAHLFDFDGGLLGTFATAQALDPGTFLGTVAWDGSRWLATVTRVMNMEIMEQIQGQPTALVVFDLDEGPVESLGLEWTSHFESRTVGSAGWEVSSIFAQRPNSHLDRRGRVTRIDGDAYTLDVYRADGTLERRIRNDADRIPVRQADIDAYEARQREQCSERAGSGCEGFIKEALPARLAFPNPEFKRVVYQFDSSPAGDLLVLRADIGYGVDAFESKHYDLFGPEGRFRGRFVQPATFRVLGLDSERLITIERGEFDVEQVVVYRMFGADGLD